MASYYADTCNYADVNDCINGSGVNTCHSGSQTGPQATHLAAAGDVINIPSGTCTWANTLSVTVNITIQGNGTPNTLSSQFGSGALNTTIIDNIPSAGVIQAQISYSPGALFRISTLDIEPNGTIALTSPIQVAGTCAPGGCPDIRIDNIGLGLTTAWSQANDSAGNCAWLIRADNVFGVLDHNSENPSNWPDFADVELSGYLGVGAFGDNSWAQPDTFGGANNLFMENNVLYTQTAFVDTEKAPFGGAIGGARYVARYNHATSNNGFGMFGNHGNDSNGRPQGGRHIEVYKNTITCIANSCNTVVGTRSGTQLVWGNAVAYTGTGFFNTFTSMAVYRAVETAPPWGACGDATINQTVGTSPPNLFPPAKGPFDTNDGMTYFTGTTTTGSSGTVMNDTSQAFPTTSGGLAPSGDPYSVFNITQNFVAEIASNTATSITVVGPVAQQQNNVFAVGDSYVIRRSSVCTGQGGRGMGLLVQGNPPVLASTGLAGPTNQALDPVYEWNDTYTTPARLNSNVSVVSTGKLIINRDYYTDNWRTVRGSGGNPLAQISTTSPFDGSGTNGIGVGFGTLANRPTSCSFQVGYFATNVGPQGTLYQCQSGSWVSYYTPYTYPHPLITAATTLSPTSANFGSVQVGNSSVNITFTLTNNSSVTITGISISNVGGAASSFLQQSTTCGSTLVASASCNIIMNFTPLTTGPLSTTLTVSDSDPSSPQTATLSGIGVIPSYAFNGSSSFTLNMPNSWKITRY